MRISSFFIVVALVASTSNSFSQETRSASNAPPRRSQSSPLVSPDLLPDGSVAFRFRAPKATEVKVAGQFGADATMTKDTQGVWSVTLPSVPAGVYEYRFVVDGLNVIDPQNSAVKPQRWPGVSILHVPANPPAPWDLQDIPHGTVQPRRRSTRWRRCSSEGARNR